VKDSAGNITEIWIRWHAVGTLSLSSASDRHYMLDRITGRLMFGDGVQGKIPPVGKANILAKAYRAGGGMKGMCEKRDLAKLRTTLPLIDKVTNYQPTAGGADQEDIDRVAMSGPRRIKSRDRAVTVEDYEWLAREATSEVAKSRCLPMTKGASLTEEDRQGADPGWVTVMIVPQGQEDQPLPTEQLIGLVKRYLTDRSLATLGMQIDVIGPRYVPIEVSAEIIPRRIEEAKTVEKRVFDALKVFLHPLSGGPDGEGWEFGRTLYLSEIGAVVQGAEGVDRVRDLNIKKPGDVVPQDRIVIGSNDLPVSGQLTILATGA
jgi:predicted phage baseplate assembly protein